MYYTFVDVARYTLFLFRCVAMSCHLGRICHDSSSSSNSSPLLIALIRILATAFILVSYYTLISKYCHRRRENSSSSEAHNGDDGDFFSSATDSRQGNSKCNHAFHLPYIDSWLKSHSNCPLEMGSRNVNGRSQSQPPEEQGERRSADDSEIGIVDVMREIEDDEREGESSDVGTSQQR